MTQERIQEFIALQTKLNEIVHPLWHKQNYDWTQAALMEAVEAYDSLPWKWWKHQSLDKQNLQTELIDVFHFILSQSIEFDINNKTNNTQQIIQTLAKAEPTFIEINHQADQTTPEDKITLLKQILKELIQTLATPETDIITIFLSWFKAYTQTGLTLEDLQIAYLTKNTLNILRQELGYKEGTYQKVFDYPPYHQLEDNQVMSLIQQTLDITDPQFATKLRQKFLEAYHNGTNKE